MIVVESNEVRNMERAAVRSGASLANLMEQAGAAVAELAMKIAGARKLRRITVMCGRGNNGGDGFVIARFLSLMCDVNVIIANGYPESDLAKLNFNLVPDKVNVLTFPDNYEECLEALRETDIIIDAIYGVGFRDCLDESSSELILNANRNKNAVRIAVDVPSGIICNTGEIPGGCFHADHTVTFTALKPLHVLYPSMDYCGEVTVAKIGVPQPVIDGCNYAMRTTDEFVARHPLRAAKKSAHKGTNGTLLSICGSYGMAGAAVLSGGAALRSGVGLLRAAVPHSVYPIVASSLTEAVFVPLEQTQAGTISFDEYDRLITEIREKCSAVLIGCGIGTGEDTERLVSELVMNTTKPLVLDADGINAIAGNIDVLRGAMAPVILTPHPGEMARLTGTNTLAVQKDRYRTARDFASAYNVTLVLKGADTLIALPDGDVYVNMTGNSGMARGGSGDVLAGMMASFLAQGMNADEAAILAVYYHGIAGDKCAEKYSPRTMLPSDMVEELKYVF